MTKEIIWTSQKIIDGLEKFKKQYGHYPTVLEIDKFNYLPSARQIQRKYGGVVKFRKLYLTNSINDFTRGKYSINRAIKITKQAIIDEDDLYNYLVRRFKIYFVHRQPLLKAGTKISADFLIYHKKGDFYIDTFRPSDYKNLITCINYKIRLYSNFNFLIYLVITNNNISNNEIYKLKEGKKKRQNIIGIPSRKLKDNIILIRQEDFLNELIKYSPIEIGVQYLTS